MKVARQQKRQPSEDSGRFKATSRKGTPSVGAHGGDHNPTEQDKGQSETWVPPEAWAFISRFW